MKSFIYDKNSRILYMYGYRGRIMLKLTKTVEYALISINYIEKNANDKPIPSKLISNHFLIPEDLLAKILQKLAK